MYSSGVEIVGLQHALDSMSIAGGAAARRGRGRGRGGWDDGEREQDMSKYDKRRREKAQDKSLGTVYCSTPVQSVPYITVSCWTRDNRWRVGTRMASGFGLEDEVRKRYSLLDS